MHSEIGRKLSLGFGAMFVLVLTLGLSGLRSISLLDSEIRGPINGIITRLDASGGFRKALSDMVAAQRALIIWTLKNDSARVAQATRSYNGALEEFERDLDQFRNVNMSAAEARAVSELDSGLARWRPLFDRMTALCAAGDVGAASDLETEIEPLTTAMLISAETLAQAQSERYSSVSDSAAGVVERARWTALGLLAVALAVVAGALVVFLRQIHGVLRNVVTELREGSKQVAGAAGQVSGASQSLADASSEQAASLEETSVSAQTLRRMTEENASHSTNSAQLVGDTEQSIHEANRSLERMIASMGEINGSSEKISKIIKVIDEIAFQTNILALNAAVEAARAGEAGRGFAVVADEVRNLAQRCGQAAKDTAQLIEESIGRSRDGGETLDQVAQAIAAITSKAAEVRTLVEQVNSGSQHQAEGIKEISDAVERMAAVTQRSAATAQETAAAGMQLRAQSAVVDRVAAQLEGLVGGGFYARAGQNAEENGFSADA